MSSLLVHITCGPENPTKATLAFFVAAAAVEAGHEVHVFLAGDAVQLLREPVRNADPPPWSGPVRMLME